ncbi:thermonuclease family protein [Agrobacterium sp. LAD9]|uniref:thermonuclease family protein n=1 Tax=Agrobacterium sp. LAD9 TaxID=2055153 RepID=UPI000D1EA878|nr:succinoglycan biosynthesis protein exoi [Agrobacterium sp. LAD9]
MKFFLKTLALSVAMATAAEAAPPGYFDLRPGVTLETGETWNDGSTRYRLYGVQSCIRGTSYTDLQGQKRDCGDASLAVLAAFIKDTKPICAATAKTSDLTYVVCYATVANERLDLGTMMVSQGFAFAALDAQGFPVFPAYSVAEQDARARNSGLWQFSDVTHPSIWLSSRVNAQVREAAR